MRESRVGFLPMKWACKYPNRFCDGTNAKVGSHWCLSRHNRGKTVQTIATMLDNRPRLQHCKPGTKHPPNASDLLERQREERLWSTAVEEWNHEMAMNNVPKQSQPKKHAAKRAGTLVVCPVIALSQWRTEIEKFTEAGTFKVGIYHGPNRTSDMPLDMMSKYDVVLTTYQVIESDFRKMVSPNKVACPNCGAKFKIDKLRVHLKYFCGEGAQRTEAQARQRRTAERHPRDGSDGGPGSSGKSKGKGKAAASAKKSMEKQPTKAAPKTRIRVGASSDYDSDSDLSLPSDVVTTKKRQARRAASSASTRMKAMVKDMNYQGAPSDSDSAFDSEDGSSSGASSGSEGASEHGSTKSAHENSAKAAILRQRKELEKFASARGSRGSKPKKRGPGSKLTKTSQKKKLPKEDESSSSEASDIDPMAGIDMDELVNEAMAGASFSPLHGFIWWRVVLDEAHFIKSRSSQTSAAAFALTSIHRWALSGTPLQNR